MWRCRLYTGRVGSAEQQHNHQAPGEDTLLAELDNMASWLDYSSYNHRLLVAIPWSHPMGMLPQQQEH